MSALGSKIRVLRENREWAQARLAEKLSVSPDTGQKWEVENNTPALPTIKEIAAVLFRQVVLNLACLLIYSSTVNINHIDKFNAVLPVSVLQEFDEQSLVIPLVTLLRSPRVNSRFMFGEMLIYFRSQLI